MDYPLAGWELLAGALESASVLCSDADDRSLTALALGCRQLRVIVRDAARAREVLDATRTLGWSHVDVVLHSHALRDLAGISVDGLVINDVAPRAARDSALGPAGYLRRFLPFLREGAFVVVLSPNTWGVGGGGAPGGALGKTTFRKLSSELTRAGLAGVEVHPVLTSSGGDLNEVLADCGYAPNRRQAGLRESLKRLLWGRHGARWLGPAFVGTAWVTTRGTRVIESILREVGNGDAHCDWVQQTVLRSGKIILTLRRPNALPPRIVAVATRSPLAIARRQHEALVLEDLRKRLPPALSELLPMPLGSPRIDGYRCFLLQHLPGVSSDAPVAGLDKITWQAAEFLISLHECTVRTLQMTPDAWSRTLGAVFESARSRNPVVLAELQPLEERVRRLVMDGDWQEVCCHGDFKIENVLYDRTTLRLSGVIDWEHCMRTGIPYVDLAYLLTYNTMIAGLSWFEATRNLLNDSLPDYLRADRGSIHRAHCHAQIHGGTAAQCGCGPSHRVSSPRQVGRGGSSPPALASASCDRDSSTGPAPRTPTTREVAVILILILCCATIVYHYFGYPALVLLVARLRPAASPRRFSSDSDEWPRLALIIAAYNEQVVIERKLRNSLSLRYPGSVEILVVSDGSSDDTPQIVSRFADQKVRSLHSPERRGKVAALNRGVAATTADILVFSDANNDFSEEALVHLAAPFADPSVGGVCGMKQIRSGEDRDSSARRRPLLEVRVRDQSGGEHHRLDHQRGWGDLRRQEVTVEADSAAHNQ